MSLLRVPSRCSPSRCRLISQLHVGAVGNPATKSWASTGEEGDCGFAARAPFSCSNGGVLSSRWDTIAASCWQHKPSLTREKYLRRQTGRGVWKEVLKVFASALRPEVDTELFVDLIQLILPTPKREIRSLS